MPETKRKRPSEPTKCRRLGRVVPPEEHANCLYCFGDAAAIESGDPSQFCDFDPRRDPINFGFPDGGGWAEPS